VGTGGFVAAIFHMVTHAFFKALMFLGAGSVIHGMHDEQDMKRMGGLARWMPITWATFMIGWLAISGIFPFAGFWSKDEILAGAWLDNKLLWAIGVLTALLTAYYMSRQVFLVFYGDERWREPSAARGVGSASEQPQERVEPAERAHVVESPWVMTAPLVILAVLSVVGGALNLPFSDSVMFLEHWLEPSFGEALHAHEFEQYEQLVLAVVATLAAAGGILAAYMTWYRRRPEELTRLEPVPLRRAWYLDAGYSAFMGGPGRWVADKTAYVIDAKVVDGAVNGVAALVRSGGSQLRKVQTGYVRNYALGVAGGVVLVLGYALVRSGM
jgi:NADH-quinone oxidoreductase subunit L